MGFSWNLLSTVALQGSVLLSTVIVARQLELERFGIYSMLVTTVMTAAAVAQGGAGIFATRFIGEFASQPDRAARILKVCNLVALATGLAATTMLFLSAPVLAGVVLGKPALAAPVRLVAIAVLFQVSVAHRQGALQGFGAFREMSMAGVCAGAGHLVFTGVGAWRWQLDGALMGFVAASAFRAVCFYAALQRVTRRHGLPTEARIGREDYRLIWTFALPASLAGYITLPCLWLVTVLVARLPNGLSMVGLYSVANQVRLTVLQLPALLNGVSFAMLSRMQGRSEHEDFRQLFRTNIAVNMGFAIPAVACLMVASNFVLGLYGSSFASGEHILMVLLVSVIPEVLGISMYQLVQTAGRMWRSLLLLILPRDLLYLGLSSLLLASHGVIGAATAYLVAQCLGLALTVMIGRGSHLSSHASGSTL